MKNDTFKWDGPPIESRRRVGGAVTETVTLTRDKITVSYSDPELCITPELQAKLQAFWATRLEEMAYRVLLCGGSRSGRFEPESAPVSPDLPDREQKPARRIIMGITTDLFGP